MIAAMLTPSASNVEEATDMCEKRVWRVEHIADERCHARYRSLLLVLFAVVNGALVLWLGEGLAWRQTGPTASYAPSLRPRRLSNEVHVRKMRMHYVPLMQKQGTGHAKYEQETITGFVAERSTASQVSVEVSAKVSAVAYSVALGAESRFGHTFSSHFKTVQTETRKETKSFTAPFHESWYLYQATTVAWLSEGSELTFGGILVSSNQPKPAVETKEVNADNVAHARSFRKGQMQYLSYDNDGLYHHMLGWGWRMESSPSFYVFKTQAPGTVPIECWRKGQMAYYLDPTWNWRPYMNQWGWRNEKIAFYAYPPGDGPKDSYEVHVWRKGQMSFYCTKGWSSWKNLWGWGWRYERHAFNVPRFGF